MVVLEMHGFEVILGMDLLIAHYTSIDCNQRKVRRLLLEGYQGFLAYVKAVSERELRIEDIPIVRDFPDVFPEDFSKLPLGREVEFVIDLILGTVSILKAPYKMTPEELKELKEQLQELLDKAFIRPVCRPRERHYFL
ncbi:uncharacterized protein LOC131158738 [Malania oleifera]|uniref:uncharacterized protein LOC131158738 n=1 Tax=Malania oleifera TaxID=397392 RepID=UPI0025ADD1BA|nr:uncharacterized protein LOC131158738 [Malania oleifera]